MTEFGGLKLRIALIFYFLPIALADDFGNRMATTIRNRTGEPHVNGIYAGETVFQRSGNSMDALHISSIDPQSGTVFSDSDGGYSLTPVVISLQNLWIQLPLPRNSDPLFKQFSQNAPVFIEQMKTRFHFERAFQNTITGQIVVEVSSEQAARRGKEFRVVSLSYLHLGDHVAIDRKLSLFLKAFGRSKDDTTSMGTRNETGFFPEDTVQYLEAGSYVKGRIQSVNGNRVEMSPIRGGRYMTIPPRELFLIYGLKELGNWSQLFDPASARKSLDWNSHIRRLKIRGLFPATLKGKPNTWLIVNYLENPVTGVVLVELARITPTADVVGQRLTRERRVVALQELGDQNGFEIPARVNDEILRHIRRSGRAEYFQLAEVLPKCSNPLLGDVLAK